MPPYLLPMVSTGSLRMVTSTVPTTTATIEPGTRLQRFGHKRMIASDRPATVVVAHVIVGRAPARATILDRNSAGSAAPNCRPSSARIWVERIVIAMPQVKPTVTGCGTNLIRLPSRRAPITNRMAPAIIVHSSRSARPYCATMSAIRPTNAPAGPPICTREPPRAETINPPMMPA